MLVPRAAVAVLDRRCGTVHAVDGCRVRVGTQEEVDLVAAAALWGTDAAEALAQYWAATQRFHRRRRYAPTSATGTEVHVAHVTRMRSRQQTGRAKVDLRVELDALERLGGETVAVLSEALGPHPDGERRVVFHVTSPELPECLGGPLGPTEIRRRIELEVRYAAWRDRKVRRLAEIRTVAEELWPDPDPEILAAWASH